VPDQRFKSNISLALGNQIYLERSHLDHLLKKIIRNPVVIVCAGAGYGKTHAVYSFVRKSHIFTSWIQLSERDNITGRFWENFIAGVAMVHKEAAVKLEKIPFPETERQFDRYLSIPRGDARTDTHYTFVYDDFHLITNRAVLNFMERSITSPFPNITSILISRTEPPLDLSSLQSRGRVGRITENDLRFTKEEMAAYFDMQHINPSAQTISAIYHDTEGWAFAIHLAGLSLKNAPAGAVYIPQAMRSNIFRLIESEIMPALSADLRKFLIQLSLLDHLALSLLREIAAGKPLIEEMDRLSSFITFDAYLNTYRIHHLFLEYLSGKQPELSEEERREIYEQAAGWCAKNNQKQDAILYYEKAGDYARVIDIIYTLPVIMPNRTARTLLELLNRAPPEIYDHIAAAHVLRTRLYFTLEMFDKAREELAAVITQLEAQPLTPAACRTLAGCYNNRGFIGMVTSSFTRDYDYVRYFEKARQYYELYPFETMPPLSVAPLGPCLCRVNSEEQGEMERYIAAISGMVPHLSVSMRGCTLGMDDLARGELAFFRGDMSGAEGFILTALHSARQGDQYETENRALFYLARIHVARGDHGAIREIFTQLEAQLAEPYYLNRFIDHDIVCGWYYAHTGQPDKLAPWLKNDFEESDLNSMAYGMEVLVKIKYHVAEKHYPAALAVLEGREGWSRHWAFVLGRIERKVLEAICRYQLRDKTAALYALEAAYRLAGPNGLDMPFVECGRNTRAILEAALKEGTTAIPAEWLEKIRRNAASYAKKLALVTEQYRQAEQPAQDPGPAEAALSRRESEVLTGLSQGLTREEIAGLLSLSANTVKSVISNIYNKLGAVNRADAVRIAASLGLV
jgi:LuxR family maltose regulon positive regulatory protein